MDNERVVREVIGYVGGIFMMGVLSKGVQMVEHRKERKKKMEEERDAGEWRIIKEETKLPNGETVTRDMLCITITEEEWQRWQEYSEDYYAEKEGLIIARVQNKTSPATNEGKVRKTAASVGKVTADVFVEGVKRRISYELREGSRSYAKSSKDTEVFLKNNLKNRLKRQY